MAIRFGQHRQSIEIVRKLADRLGVTELNDFDDVVPLLFSHTAFKSYPAALIDNKRFDLMTKWLDKLTSHDLSDVDTDGCDSIDEWIDRLDAADTAGGDHLQRHHGHPVDHPEGQARSPRGHGAVEDLPVSDVRQRNPPRRSSTPPSTSSGPTTPAASSAICGSPT